MSPLYVYTCSNVSPIGRHKSWLLIGRGILNFIEYIYWSTKQSKHAIHTIIQIIICPKSIKDPTNPPTTRCRRDPRWNNIISANRQKCLFFQPGHDKVSEIRLIFFISVIQVHCLQFYVCLATVRIEGCFISSISATIKSHLRDWREEEVDGFYGGEWQSWEM